MKLNIIITYAIELQNTASAPKRKIVASLDILNSSVFS